MSLLARLLASLRAGYLALVGWLSSSTRAIGHAVAGSARTIGGAVSPVVPSQWKQRIALLFVTGLAFVPIIYSGNMTWSFNDPSGHLNQITAAVVDEDQGGTTTSADGTQTSVNVGRTFTDTLLGMDKNTVYRFVETDRATAEKGLADGTYGATVEVPASFSADVASLGGDPMKATPALLTVRTNDTVNYVGGNFTKSVGTALRESLSTSVLEQYLDNVYVGFTTIHDQISEAADSANRLADGAEQLHSGTTELAGSSEQLADGASTLRDGTADLVVGLSQISTGAQTLSAGSSTLAGGAKTLAQGLATLDANGSTLRGGASALSSGADQLADGSARLADGTAQVADGTQQLDTRLQAARQRAQELGITQASVDQSAADLQTSVDDLARVATTVNDSLATPAADAASLAQTAGDNATAVHDAATQARSTADAIAQGAQDATTVRDGSTALASSASSLAAAQQAAPGQADAASTLSTDVKDYTSTLDDLAAQCAEDSSASSSASDGGGAPSSDLCDRLSALAAGSDGLRSEASDVASGAATQRDQISAAATPTLADGTAAPSAQDVADASQRLATLLGDDQGRSGLAQGADAVADAAEGLEQPANDLAGTARTVSDDVATARSAVGDQSTDHDAVQARIDALHAQASTAVQALPTVYEQADQAVDAVDRLNAGAQQTNQGAQQLSSASGRLASGSDSLSQGVDRYTAGVSSASNGADTLAGGAQSVADGASALSAATDEATAGARKVDDGAGQLADGSARLADGAQQVDDGAAQVADGDRQLADGMGQAEDRVPSYTGDERAHLEKAAADPVGLSFVRKHGLDRFGEGLAPLFLSISLWVGGMAIFLMMPPFAEAALRRGASALGLLLGGLLPAQLLGLVQTVIAVGILHLAVGITAQDLPMFFLIACLTSFVFVALNHGFGAIAGPIGKFIALVLVALQVSGAGGTYPVGTLPGFFRAIHPYLPMTHSVDAFRGAIGGGWVDPLGDVTVLLVWLLIGLACGFVGAVLQRRRARRDMTGALPAQRPGRRIRAATA